MYNIVVLLMVMIKIVGFVRAQDAPITPNKVYAKKGATVELPCAAGTSGQKLKWLDAHGDKYLVSWSTTFTDTSDPDLLTKVIYNVQLSDAGSYVCSDGSNASPVELVVIEIASPENIEAQVTAPDKVKVLWEAPKKNPGLVRGYHIYVTEITGSAREVNFVLDTVFPTGKEEFLLVDMSPGATYEIQVVALYPNGPDDEPELQEGPRSHNIRINTPTFDSPPFRVTAKPWMNSTILVRWGQPRNVDSKVIVGYKVYYTAIGRRKGATRSRDVTSPGPDGQWQMVLAGLRTKTKYIIEVAAIYMGRKIPEKKSPGITFRHDGFAPEISLRVIPLGPQSVLVILHALGGGRVEKLRLLYSDDKAIKWERVRNFKSKDMYAMVTNLQPRSIYYFMAKARVNRKSRQVITHVQTPPSDLRAPSDVKVSAQSYDSIKVKWEHEGKAEVTGFIVRVERQTPSGQFTPDKQKVVFKENEVLVDELRDDQKYQVKVQPFDMDGKGMESEPVMFHIAESDITTPATIRDPIQFIEEPPDVIHISPGEDIELTCVAVGDPVPKVRWYKSGVLIGVSGDNRNVLHLSGLQESTNLTCVATSDYDTQSRMTEVKVVKDLEESPSFVVRLPEKLVVKLGGQVTMTCAVKGFPVPIITWYKDGRLQRILHNIRTYIEGNVRRPAILKCRAENIYGRIEATTKLLIEEYLVAPTPAVNGKLPTTVDKSEGEGLQLNCAFRGSPSPMVTWYDGTTPIGPANKSENTLIMTSVKRSTILTCKGENDAGIAEQAVQLTVKAAPDTSTVAPAEDGYKVHWSDIVLSDRDMDITWTIDQGDLDSIRFYDVILTRNDGVEVMRRQIQDYQRRLKLQNLTPNARYIMNFKLISKNNVGYNTTREIGIMNPASLLFGEPKATIAEIRPDSFLVVFPTFPSDYQYQYRFRLQEVNPLQQVFDFTYTGETQNVRIEKLIPDRSYLATVDAIQKRYGMPTKTAQLEFRTPLQGGYSEPVSALLNVTGSTPSTGMLTTRKPVMTEMTTDKPTTIITTSAILTDNEAYKLSLTTPIKTPYMTYIQWTVDRGDLDKIKNFLITIKGESGRKLLQQELKENQRSITIQSLTPRATYAVNLKAQGSEGVLEQTDTTFATPSADAIQVVSPVLNFEANELRPTSVRFLWLVVNGSPNMVRKYRVSVQDGGPDGWLLLEQIFDAESLSLKLRKLTPNKRYHATVEAIGDNDQTVMRSSVFFQTPGEGRHGIPVRASSSETRDKKTSTGPHNMTRSPMEGQGPLLDMELLPMGGSAVRVKWGLAGILPAMEAYKIKVRVNGHMGDVLLEQTMSSRSAYFDIRSIDPSQIYYVELTAVNAKSQPLLSVASLYRMTSGHVRASSAGITPRGKSKDNMDKSSPDPTRDPKHRLDLTVTPESDGTSASLSWTYEGPEGSLFRFRIKVKENGPLGKVLLEDEIQRQTREFRVNSLQRGQLYYFEVYALAASGVPLARVASPYLVPRPGSSPQPIQTSSEQDNVSPDKTTREHVKIRPEIYEPILSMEIKPEGRASAQMTWELTGIDNSAVGYRVELRSGAPHSRERLLLDDQFGLSTEVFTMNGLQHGHMYYAELQALGSNGQPILRATARYLHPQPTSASSLTTNQISTDIRSHPPPPTTTTRLPPSPPPNRGNSDELVITQMRPTGPSTLYVEWHPADNVPHTGGTMLRYARFNIDTLQRDRYEIVYISDSNTATLTGLIQGSNYGVAVGPMTSSGQYVRWSKMKLQQMPTSG